MNEPINENTFERSGGRPPKQFIVLIGNYGSGKTELALNFALRAVRQEGIRTALVDHDIVNPYFRSAQRTQMLEEAGIRVIATPYGGSHVDLPVVSAEVMAAFDDDSIDCVVFDVGGDPVGATALGRYHAHFARMGYENVHAYFVVNARRPLTRTPDEVTTLFEQIQSSARIPIEGFINNSNLARESSVADLVAGQELLREVSAKLGKPVLFTSGRAALLEDFAKSADERDCIGQLMGIDIYMRPDWLDFEA